MTSRKTRVHINQATSSKRHQPSLTREVIQQALSLAQREHEILHEQQTKVFQSLSREDNKPRAVANSSKVEEEELKEYLKKLRRECLETLDAIQHDRDQALVSSVASHKDAIKSLLS